MIVQTVYPEEVDDISLTTYTRKGIKNSSTITWAKWIKHVELLKSCVIKQSSPDYQVSPSYFSIPTQVTCIYFTDIKIPSSVSSDAITDFSKDKDGGVVAWLDTNDDTKMYVSTQKEGVKVKGNAYSFSMFYDRNRNNNYFNSIDLSNFDTSKIVNMSYMFRYCTKLTTLDVSKFDTSNVINMDRMFSGCSSLTSLDVANWDTSNVLNMSHMFDGCSSLTRLDVSEWNTIDVIWMDGMFAECSSLTTIYIFCPNARYVDYMFDGCSSLTRIYISALMSVLSMSYMFIGCIHLDELYLYDVNTSCVTSMGHMFDGCSSLTSLDVSSFDTSKVTNMGYMFSGCSSLTSLDVSSFDTSKVTDMRSMFSGCSSLTSIKVGDKFKWAATLRNLGLTSAWKDEKGNQYTLASAFPSNVAHSYTKVS